MDLKKYYNIYQRIEKNADALWSKLSFTTMDEVMKEEVDLKKTRDKAWELSNILRETRKAQSSELTGINDDDYFDSDVEKDDTALEDIYSRVDSKIDFIVDVADKLRDIKDEADESGVHKTFGSI